MVDDKVGEQTMAGGHKWVTLDMQILASTHITHAMPPEQAIKFAENIIAKAKELQEYNQALEDEKWENRGGCPVWECPEEDQ